MPVRVRLERLFELVGGGGIRELRDELAGRGETRSKPFWIAR